MFKRGKISPTPDAREQVRELAERVTRTALWRQGDGLAAPTVVITGYGGSGLTGAGPARERGRQRAENVAQLFRAHLDAEPSTVHISVETGPPMARRSGDEAQRRVTIGVRYPTTVDAQVTGQYMALTETAPGLRLEPDELDGIIADYVSLSAAHTLEFRQLPADLGGHLRDLDKSLAGAGRVRSMVNDLVLAASVVITRDTDAKSLQFVSVDRLRQLVTGIAADLRRGRDPFMVPRGTLAGIDYQPSAALSERLAKIGLIAVSLNLRAGLQTDELFISLGRNESAFLESSMAAFGHDEQLFLTTCVPSTVNIGLRRRVPSLPALLRIGDDLAHSMDDVLDQMSPQDRQRSDRFGGRSIEDLIRGRATEAAAQFAAVRNRATELAGRPESDPAAWADLLTTWSRSMQKLGGLLTLQGIPGVLTPMAIPGDWNSSAVLAIPKLVDRPIRRLTATKHLKYASALANKLNVEPDGSTFGIGDDEYLDGNVTYRLSERLTSRDDWQRYWTRLSSGHGAVVSSPAHALHLAAESRDGQPVFVVSDPMRSTSDILTLDQAASWATREKVKGVEMKGGSSSGQELFADNGGHRVAAVSRLLPLTPSDQPGGLGGDVPVGAGSRTTRSEAARSGLENRPVEEGADARVAWREVLRFERARLDGLDVAVRDDFLQRAAVVLRGRHESLPVIREGLSAEQVARVGLLEDIWSSVAYRMYETSLLHESDDRVRAEGEQLSEMLGEIFGTALTRGLLPGGAPLRDSEMDTDAGPSRVRDDSVEGRRGVARAIGVALQDGHGVAEVIRQVHRSGRGPDEVRALEVAFQDEHGRTLADALSDAVDEGRLTEVEFEQVLRVLGYQHTMFADPAQDVRVTSTAGPDPSSHLSVRRVAAELRENILQGRHDHTLALLRGLDRDVRAIWAVHDAYRKMFGIRLNNDLNTRLPAEHAAYVGHLLGEVSGDAVPEAIARQWFQELQHATFEHERFGELPIPTGYPEDGCTLRAHLWALRLQQLGAPVRKITVARTDPPLSMMSATKAGATQDQPAQVRWPFHIAPVVRVLDAQGNATWKVFDPVMGAGLLSTQDWLARTGVDGEVRAIDAPQQQVHAEFEREFAHNPEEWTAKRGIQYPRKAIVVLTDMHALDFPSPRDGIVNDIRHTDDIVRSEADDLAKHSLADMDRQLQRGVRDLVDRNLDADALLGHLRDLSAGNRRAVGFLERRVNKDFVSSLLLALPADRLDQLRQIFPARGHQARMEGEIQYGSVVGDGSPVLSNPYSSGSVGKTVDAGHERPDLIENAEQSYLPSLTDIDRARVDAPVNQVSDPIGYEVRRMEVVPGRWVQEATVRVFVRGDAGLPDREALAARYEDLLEGVEARFNRGYLMPGGEQFRLNVVCVADESDAHAVLDITADQSSRELADQVGEVLGLPAHGGMTVEHLTELASRHGELRSASHQEHDQQDSWYVGKDSAGRERWFRVDSVVSQPLVDSQGRHIGTTFFDQQRDRQDIETWATRTRRHGTLLTQPNLTSGEQFHLKNEQTRGSGFLKAVTPWTGDEAAIVAAHGSREHAKVHVMGLGEVEVSGDTLVHIAVQTVGFGDALKAGRRTVTVFVCNAGSSTKPGGLGHDMHSALRRLNLSDRLFAATDEHMTLWYYRRLDSKMVIFNGGHWNVFGDMTPEHATAFAHELATAVNQNWTYAENELSDGDQVLLSDRNGTIRLVRDIVDAVRRGNDRGEQHAQHLIDNLAANHERPDIVAAAVHAYFERQAGSGSTAYGDARSSGQHNSEAAPDGSAQVRLSDGDGTRGLVRAIADAVVRHGGGLAEPSTQDLINRLAAGHERPDIVSAAVYAFFEFADDSDTDSEEYDG